MSVVEWIADRAARQERFGRAFRQQECYEVLVALGGRCELGQLLASKGFSSSVITGLEKKGLIAREEPGEEIAQPGESEVRHPLGGQADEIQRGAPDEPASYPRILLVDDDESIGLLVRHRLSRAGFEVQHITHGDDALELLWDEKLAGELDLVILDVKLPGAGGLELLRELRQMSFLRRLPVIMLTSMGRETDIVRAFDLGADDYVVKPFSPAELMARVRRLLEGRRRPAGGVSW